jgi:magnesium chelatase subunit D
MAYEDDPKAFAESYVQQEMVLRDRIEAASKLLPQIIATEANRLYIVSKCLEAEVQGHRADLTLEETAKAVAAWKGHTEITKEDIDEAAPYVLLHRRRNTEQPPEEEPQEQQEQDQNEDHDAPPPPEQKNSDGPPPMNPPQGRGKDQNFAMGKSFKVADFGHNASRQTHKGFGKRTTAKSAGKMGRYVYSVQQNLTGDLALDATIRAAAPYQISRNKNGLAIAIREADIREKVRQRKYANLIVFVVDASGSMGASQRMTETKGAILSLLKDAYVKRDKVCLIAFRGNEAQVLLPPTRSVDRGVRLLETMAVGGRTPLNHGIAKGMQVIQSELKKNPGVLPYMVMITDGKGNVSIDNTVKPKQELMEISEKLRAFPYINTMVLDIERKGAMSFGIAKEMALRMGASYQKIETLNAGTIIRAIERVR